MPDWTQSMQRTYEYYIVDPGTWRDVKKLDNVKKCTLNPDLTSETLGSATYDIVDAVGECYIRTYLITIQNGVREKRPIGTYLVQTPTSTFNGKTRAVTMDGYTPLLELKENPPPIGYFLLEGENIMQNAYVITREHVRAPVVRAVSDDKLGYDFVANTNDSWLSFNADLIKNAKYSYGLDEMGRVLFAPIQDINTLQPVWTYDDSNSSILYPELTLDHDIFGIPNVIEIVYSKGFYDLEDGGTKYFYTIRNDDPNSPTSTVSRGRPITHRETDPSLVGISGADTLITSRVIHNYAEQLLKEMSSVEYTVTYSHAFCPVRVGDCVRLNYTLAGVTGVNAKVISQSIPCTPACKVTEKAVFTAKLWR